jgi:hypothetical protein
LRTFSKVDEESHHDLYREALSAVEGGAGEKHVFAVE